MKKIFVYGISVLMSASLAVSCVNDLDTKPLSETVYTADKAFADPASYGQYINYAYSYLTMVSQDSESDTDLSAIGDPGQSEFIRMYLALNEMSVDAMMCSWTDPYVPTLTNGTWNSNNVAVMAVYLRGLKGVAICNNFLTDEISGDAAVTARGHADKLKEIHQYRAEMQLQRALYYSILLDTFGNPPMIRPEHIGGADFPAQLSTNFTEGRRLLFNWLEKELKEVIANPDMPATRAEVEYPRFTKGAAWAILARMYLNAEVYTGTPRWSDAMAAAEEVIDNGGFKLWGLDGRGKWTDLFREDNTESGAAPAEFIVAASYDAVYARSWGGSTTMVFSVIDSDGQVNIPKLFGLDAMYTDTWNGYHVSTEFVEKNFALQGVKWGEAQGKTPDWGYDRDASDRRAWFYNYGYSKVTNNNPNTILSGWACVKWLPLDSYDRPYMLEHNYDVSSCDFPVYRLAEMYLIYAEAEARTKGGSLSSGDKGHSYLSDLNKRAGNADIPLTVDLDWILKERVRELMWEGHRRTDLIRYGEFTTGQWPFKGGLEDGRVTYEDYRKVFPIINSDIIANPKLVQNPGY